ncbi:MAG: lysophospholipid acyltransferase family protein [Pseudomonadota bacterium]|nr:lysophospholipid acyltransferase family protein [Pseudomonadota bacterium]
MIVWLRALAFNAWFWTWTSLMLVAFLPGLLFPRQVLMAGQRIWARGINLGLRLLVGLRYEVRGRENLPAAPAIVASKHQSAWDTIIWHLAVPDPAVVMKKELLSLPLYGWYCRHTRQIPIDRSAGAKALREMLHAARAARDAGRHLVIFPEGTRVAPGETGTYLPGVAALYRDLGLPVVPVAVNSGLYWGRNAFVKRPGTIVMQYLEPIPAGLDRKDFMRRLETAIETASRDLIPSGR